MITEIAYYACAELQAAGCCANCTMIASKQQRATLYEY